MSRLTALLGMLVMSVAVLAATWPLVGPEMQLLFDHGIELLRPYLGSQ